MTLVTVLDPIHDDGLARLAHAYDVVTLWPVDDATTVPEATEILVVRTTQVTPADLDRLADLRLIVKHGVGVDNLDLAACTERGVLVCNTPGVGAQAVAEHAVTLVVACAKQLITLDRSQRAADFDVRHRTRTVELDAKTAGIVGLGNIGRRAARMLRGFGMNTVGFDPYLPPDVEIDGLTRVSTLEELVGLADAITLHLPLTDENRHLFDKRILGLMRPGSIIVNTSRGGLIDEAALVELLRAGHLRAAGLDVFDVEPPPDDDPLWALDNVIVTPHIAGLTEETGAHLSIACAETVEHFLAGAPLSAMLNPDARNRS